MGQSPKPKSAGLLHDVGLGWRRAFGPCLFLDAVFDVDLHGRAGLDLPRRLRRHERLGAGHRLFDGHSGASRRPQAHQARPSLQDAHDGRLSCRPL